MLRGGGLFGLTGYDGGVYYAAGAGLAHGRLPYADFLLLHPPGIVLALLPFGLLGRVVGDPAAMALARLAWTALGAVNALLVAAALRRHGLVAALVGGLLYAVWLPAVVVERTTTLETVTGFATLGAVWLLSRPAPAVLAGRAALLAGVLLGVSAATKIWGVAPLLAVVVWCAVEHGRRRAVAVALGGAVSTVLVCLPFFVMAPVAMWGMVVRAQVGRPRMPVDLRTKAVDTTGLSELPHVSALLVVGVAAVVVGGAVLAVLKGRTRLGRLALVLLLVGLALLAVSPSWSVDYASLVAAPVALLVGGGTGVAVAALDGRRPLRALVVLAVLGGVVTYTAASAPRTTFGSHFPGRTLARVVADVPGCVTADDPAALVEAGVLGRNLDRGCPLVVDLGGYSYYLRPGADLQVSRARNEQWQAFTLAYLRSGDAAVVVRFADLVGLSRPTKETVASWPELGPAGRYAVRRPAR